MPRRAPPVFSEWLASQSSRHRTDRPTASQFVVRGGAATGPPRAHCYGFAMKFASLEPAAGLLCAIGSLCVACASGGGETSASDDGSAPDVTTRDVSSETSSP